jgi:D-glycerate 3-kinase
VTSDDEAPATDSEASSLPADYRALAETLVARWVERGPRRVGLAGGQGAGKSTLGRAIEGAGARVGLRIAVLSLDDFYLSRAERQRLAAAVHPLFETRGPPGTHDIARCRAAMTALLRAGEVELPSFDKGRDDTGPSRHVRGPFDLVLLEGWCVGAPASAPGDLDRPRNRLERELDPDGVWRRHVNACLAGDYATLWRELEELVFLRVPGLEAVRRWRLQQEAARPPARRLGAERVARFVEHFERITLAMLDALPDLADCVVDLTEDHSVASVTWRSAPPGRAMGSVAPDAEPT